MQEYTAPHSSPSPTCGREILKTVVELLRTVEEHDPAYDLCQKLAAWLERALASSERVS